MVNSLPLNNSQASGCNNNCAPTVFFSSTITLNVVSNQNNFNPFKCGSHVMVSLNVNSKTDRRHKNISIKFSLYIKSVRKQNFLFYFFFSLGKF